MTKAEHLESNWQDKGMARVWNRIARRFDKLVPSLELSDDVLGFRR